MMTQEIRTCRGLLVNKIGDFIMKKILVIALALMMPLCTMAQKKCFKLVEKSGDKPEWVNKGSVKGYIIVQSEKPTLEEVKADAMQKVRSEIAASVATNVSRTVNSYSQKTMEGDVSSTNRKMTIESTSKIAKMPAIQGVSITKADTYHEVYKNKKSGETYYNFYAKYPFSDFDLVELVTAYETHEKEIDEQIKSYEDALGNIETVEQIDSSITALGALNKELGEDDGRTERVNGIVNRYVKIYDNISIEIVENNPGKAIVKLVYDGKTITTSQKPRVSSNCADQFDAKNLGDKIVVNYKSEYCYAQDDNFIEIRFRFGSKYVKKQVYFKLK